MLAMLMKTLFLRASSGKPTEEPQKSNEGSKSSLPAEQAPPPASVWPVGFSSLPLCRPLGPGTDNLKEDGRISVITDRREQSGDFEWLPSGASAPSRALACAHAFRRSRAQPDGVVRVCQPCRAKPAGAKDAVVAADRGPQPGRVVAAETEGRIKAGVRQCGRA